MISQAPLDFEPYDEEPRRSTPLLIVAAAVGAIALVVIGYILLTGGGGPGPSPSPTNGASTSPAGSASPAPSRGPGATTIPGPTDPPSAADGLAEAVCGAPRAPFDRLRTELLEGFAGYCLESIAAVVVDRSIDPLRVAQVGWAFTAGPAGGDDSAVFSRVYLLIDGGRRAQRFDVAHSSTGAPAAVIGDPTRPRQIADPLLVYLWERPEAP